MNKFMEEKAQIRNEAMEMILPRFNSAFTEALKVPHNNEWYIPVDMGEGKPCYIKVVMSVPEWVGTENEEGRKCGKEGECYSPRKGR